MKKKSIYIDNFIKNRLLFKKKNIYLRIDIISVSNQTIEYY